jgi:TonB family protein
VNAIEHRSLFQQADGIPVVKTLLFVTFATLVASVARAQDLGYADPPFLEFEKAAEIHPDIHVKVIRQDPLEYPISLAYSGMRGEVLIDFLVDEQGNVTKTNVVRSSHPDFEAPAVEAVLKWKFKPAMKGGHPVVAYVRVPVLFSADNAPYRGRDVWFLPPTASKKLPAEFQYDEAPNPLVTSAPVYPFELLSKHVTGSATVRFAIDPLGHTHFVRLEKASLPEFGAAATAMIAAWTFQPAKKGGKPCWALVNKDQIFNESRSDFPINESAERLLNALKIVPCPIVSNLRGLDSVPKGRFQPSPVVPDSVKKANVTATATVEFILDHAGHAQLPRVISATDPDFGWAAATAVARWQYTQPLKNGKPVDVLVEIPLVYQPVPPPAPGT